MPSDTVNLSIINLVNKSVFGTEDVELPLWENSPFLKFYLNKNGKQRGTWGERYFKEMCKLYGVKVEPSDNAGHDGKFNGIKIEIKTNSSSGVGNNLKINWAQIRPSQDYEFMIGQVVTPSEIVYFRFSAEDIKKIISEGKIGNQHGGKAVLSGTYILNKSKIPEWVLPYKIKLADIISDLGK